MDIDTHIDNTREQPNENLLLVRLRRAPGSDGPLEWCGSINGINEDEAHSFSDWPTFMEILLDMQEQWEREMQLWPKRALESTTTIA